MNRLAEDVFQIPLAPRDTINAYLIGDVVVDAGIRVSGRRIVKAVAGHSVSAHALTHAHGDHAGGSRYVCETLGVPLWAGAGDADAAAAGKPVMGRGPAGWLMSRVGTWPGVKVDRPLEEGDDAGSGFVVLDVPGHSAGHVAYWRESDRTLVCGDVYFNVHPLTGVPGLHEPPAGFTPDPTRNRESARRLAQLEPELVLFGHGPPLRDPAKLKEFAGSLA